VASGLRFRHFRRLSTTSVLSVVGELSNQSLNAISCSILSSQIVEDLHVLTHKPYVMFYGGGRRVTTKCLGIYLACFSVDNLRGLRPSLTHVHENSESELPETAEAITLLTDYCSRS
jgi:hypothetical protein